MKDIDIFVFARLITEERITKQGFIGLDWGIINILFEQQGRNGYVIKLTNGKKGNYRTKFDRIGLRIYQCII